MSLDMIVPVKKLNTYMPMKLDTYVPMKLNTYMHHEIKCYITQCQCAYRSISIEVREYDHLAHRHLIPTSEYN